MLPIENLATTFSMTASVGFLKQLDTLECTYNNFSYSSHSNNNQHISQLLNFKH